MSTDQATEKLAENLAKTEIAGETNSTETVEGGALKIDQIHPEDDTSKVVVKSSEGETELEPHLQSQTTFENLGLSEDLLKGVYALKYVKPSQIQASTLPSIIAGKNVIGQAQTGSGKTACFAIGMIRAVDISKNVTQSLCLSPTRELTIQSFNVCKALSKFLPKELRQTLLVAQESYPEQKMNQQIVFGTPGTVLQFIKRRLLDISNLRVFAVDEADTMVDADNLGQQTMRVHQMIPANTQVLLFSATFEKEAVYKLAKALVKEPLVEVMVKREALSLDGIKQFSVECRNSQEKFKVLSDIFGELTVGQTIIFVERIEDANELYNNLVKENHNVSVLHSQLTHDARDKVMREFRAGKTRVLVATNVLARGIDILQINLTINFDVPLLPGNRSLPDVETYLHRSGRSARFGRKGITLNFVDSASTQAAVDAISRYWQKPIIAVQPAELAEKLQKAMKEISQKK